MNALNTSSGGASKTRMTRFRDRIGSWSIQAYSCCFAPRFAGWFLVLRRCHDRFHLRQTFIEISADHRFHVDYIGFSQLTIQGVPNWSMNMPNRWAQNVSCSGMRIVPFTDRAV